jgi:hypothetical protein
MNHPTNQPTTQPQVLVLKHRGVGKVPLALSQLPPSLTSLALKKALLTLDVHDADARGRERAVQQQQMRQQMPSEVPTAPPPPAPRAPSPPSPPPLRRPSTPGASDGLPPRPPSRTRSGSLPPLLQQQPSSALQQQPAQQPVLPPPLLPPPPFDPLRLPAYGAASPGPSHAVESPQFNRNVRSGTLSTAPSLSDLPQLPQQLAAAGSGAAAPSRPVNGSLSRSQTSDLDLLQLGAAADAGAVAPCLRGLRALFLHTCLVDGGVAAHVGRVSDQLTQLSVVGPDGGPPEEQEAWLAQAMRRRLGALQVLDLSIPDTWRAAPARLAAALSRLPRLRHLHVALAGGPGQIEALACLSRLKTLAVDYSGPPALPAGLQARLEAALPATKVQVWEQLRARTGGSDGGGGGAGEGRWWGLRGWGLRAAGGLVVAAVVAGLVRVAGRAARRQPAISAG